MEIQKSRYLPKIAVYPGTFDPITYGHIDVIKRALFLCDKLIVGVAERKEKKPLFSLKERVELAKKSLAWTKKVEVEGFKGLLIEFVRKRKAKIIIRGLRAISDFDYEFQMALTNRKIAPDIETVFFLPAEEYSYVSSSLVKEIASLGGDISKFVPPPVVEALKRKFKK